MAPAKPDQRCWVMKPKTTPSIPSVLRPPAPTRSATPGEATEITRPRGTAQGRGGPSQATERKEQAIKGLGRTTDDQQLQLEGRPDQANGDPTQARREAPECLRQPAPRRPSRKVAQPRAWTRAAQIRVTGGHATTSGTASWCRSGRGERRPAWTRASPAPATGCRAGPPRRRPGTLAQKRVVVVTQGRC